jgi:hypothetical protein
MDEAKREKLAEAFDALPSGCRYAPATLEQLAAFEKEFQTIPNDYRWFLLRCGGGTVGPEWVDGIDDLFETHRKFNAEAGIENGWNRPEVFIIGWDGYGNPFGIERTTGRVLMQDHDFGGIHKMAPSLESFLERGLLGNN